MMKPLRLISNVLLLLLYFSSILITSLSSITNTFILETLNKYRNFTFVTFVEFTETETVENTNEIINQSTLSNDIKLFYLLRLPDFDKKTNLTMNPRPFNRFVVHLSGFVILETGVYSKLKLKLFSDTVCSTYFPLTRKNVDIYIFQTRLLIQKTSSRNALLRDSFNNSVRFKIILYSIENNITVNIDYSVCQPNIPSIKSSRIKWELSSLIHRENILKCIISDNKYNTGNMNGKLLRITVPIMASEIEMFRYKSINIAKRGPWKYLIEEYLMVVERIFSMIHFFLKKV